MSLTPRQLEILKYIIRYIQENKYAPTLREMADQFDISRVTVLQHLRALEEKEYLIREEHRARGIEVTKKADQVKQSILSTSTQSAHFLHDSSTTYGTASNEKKDTRQSPPSFDSSFSVRGTVDRDGGVTKQEQQNVQQSESADHSLPRNGVLLQVLDGPIGNVNVREGDCLMIQTGSDLDKDEKLYLITDDKRKNRLARCQQTGNGVRVTSPNESGERMISRNEMSIHGRVIGFIRTVL